MDFSLIILIIIAIIVGFVILKILKNIMMAVISIVLFIVVAMLLMGIFLYIDMPSFQQSFINNDKMILFTDGGIIGGYIQNQDNESLLSQEEIENLNNLGIVDNKGKIKSDILKDHISKEKIDVVYIVDTGFVIEKDNNLEVLEIKQKFQKKMESESIYELILGYKSGNVGIFPKPKLLNLVDFIPRFIVDFIIGQIR